jgi:hypothetical protein
MARRKDDGGHPIFWLLLGFLGGVAGTLGALLLLSSEVTGTGEPPPIDDPVIMGEPTPLDGAPPAPGTVMAPLPGAVVPAPLPAQVPQPQTQPRFPTEAPAAAPAAPAAKPAPRPPAPRAAAPSNEAQIAEDAAASGMTARTR